LNAVKDFLLTDNGIKLLQPQKKALLDLMKFLGDKKIDLVFEK
jgi:hypothetical protein